MQGQTRVYLYPCLVVERICLRPFTAETRPVHTNLYRGGCKCLSPKLARPAEGGGLHKVVRVRCCPDIYMAVKTAFHD